MILEKKYTGIGAMSGTSLDGLDIAVCEFTECNTHFHYKILHAITIPYDTLWTKRLENAHRLSGLELIQTHKEYGFFIGEHIATFINDKNVFPDFIASHGHTIFHNPAKNLTFQLGDGASIAASANTDTISDFRSLDVALNGQGAPLVPIGDQMLFHEYDYCLNLGGFANISFQNGDRRIAFDICPVNKSIHHISNKLGKIMDENGEIARQGETNNALFEILNNLEYYNIPPPKSLGREWLEENVIPALDNSGISLQDQMRTLYEHIVFQISRVFPPNKKMLITGGGAKNTFLTALLQKNTNGEIYIPDARVVDYKEALIFAFLGLMRIKNKPNCLSSVTGSRKDNIGGTIYKI